MSGLYKKFKMDVTREVEGIPIQLGNAENEDGTVPTFYISRMSMKTNKAYQKAHEAAIRPHRRAVALGTMKQEIADDIMLTLFVDHILKGWENVFGEDGEKLVFSRDTAKKLLSDLNDLYILLENESLNADNFREACREDDAKN